MTQYKSKIMIKRAVWTGMSQEAMIMPKRVVQVMIPGSISKRR